MKNSKAWIIGLTLVAVFLALYIVLTIFILFFTRSSQSHSLTRNWKVYDSLEDWDLAGHATQDIDGDGTTDMVTMTHCVYLSTLQADDIPQEKRCVEPGMVGITFRDLPDKVGQALTPNRPFFYSWLRKSYLVQTQNNVWRVYDMNGLQLRVYELKENKLFEEVTPSLLDRIDLLTYQGSHLGVVLVLVLMLGIFGW